MDYNPNGKKTKDRRESGSDQCNSENAHIRVGSFQGEGGSAQNEQDGFDSSDRSGESLFSRGQTLAGSTGGLVAGKILDCLRLLKDEHLAYVRSNRQKLEASLNENKESENRFLQACDNLEKQILSLIPEQENL